jgi:hypothetical protein
VVEGRDAAVAAGDERVHMGPGVHVRGRVRVGEKSN